jgi:hypothetical protein
MRKRIIDRGGREASAADEQWLDLEALARVEITSEDAAHPIEAALTPAAGEGWRAAQPGAQTIRIVFDEPVRLRRARLEFHEPQRQRTQEFVLRWSPDGGHSYREVVRQQYHFSPPGTDYEIEDYALDLHGVTALELSIVPEIGEGDACASLLRLRLA